MSYQFRYSVNHCTETEFRIVIEQLRVPLNNEIAVTNAMYLVTNL